MKLQSRSGFTLIELLIVIAVIGLLSTISIIVLNSARVRSRDARRVSDIQVIRSALEQHWLENAAYPSNSTPINLGAASAVVLTSNGFQTTPTGAVYLPKVPTGPSANEYYIYNSSSPTVGYTLQVTTEGTTVYGSKGTYYAHSNGVDTDPTNK
jgi:type II secretion system protein G